MTEQPKWLKQVFGNKTDRVMFIFLEASTSRYCLFPGQELLLHYDSNDIGKHGASLAIELLMDGSAMQLTVWTDEFTMFHPDGRQAEKCYDGFEEMQLIYERTLLAGTN